MIDPAEDGTLPTLELNTIPIGIAHRHQLHRQGQDHPDQEKHRPRHVDEEAPEPAPHHARPAHGHALRGEGRKA